MKPVFTFILMFTMLSFANAQKVDKKLRAELLKIYKTDQQYRKELTSMGPESPNFLSLWRKQNTLDSINLQRVVVILDSVGYPGYDRVGGVANEAAFYVIQHADVKYQVKYLPIIVKAADKKQLPWADVAKMIDRIKVDQGEKQIYGTQLVGKKNPATGFITNEFEFAPVADPKNVNQRRKRVGLNTIQEQAKEFGVVFKPY